MTKKEEYVIQLWKVELSDKLLNLCTCLFVIYAITNKAKLQAERERGYPNDEEAKSPESRAKCFQKVNPL
jgi:hypothetical protein